MKRAAMTIPMKRRFVRSMQLWMASLFLLLPMVEQLWAAPAGNLEPTETNKLVLAHFMPWFQSKQGPSGQWGWHWTMNSVAIETNSKQPPRVASHYRPAIGPYDSGDPTVLEYQLLSMKLAGIDGVIVDWYGLEDFRDYSVLHRNTLTLVEQVERLGMKFAICYEDQTIPALVEAKKLSESERVAHAVRELQWLNNHWFPKKAYVQWEGKPLLLSFGQSGLSNEEWSQCLALYHLPISYFSLHNKRLSAIGVFDWPQPSIGMDAVHRFYQDHEKGKRAIPVVFPRFHDYYEQAKVGKSYGEIFDDNGETFRRLWEQAWKSPLPIIQLATWNDWGEGTQIEPSVEHGYRDLEIIYQTVRTSDPTRVPSQASDLKMAFILYELRLAKRHSSEVLDRVSIAIANQDWATARNALRELSKP